MERRLTQSHPEYREINNLSQLIALAVNPQLTGCYLDILEPERLALIEELKSELQKELDRGDIPQVFAEFIGVELNE